MNGMNGMNDSNAMGGMNSSAIDPTVGMSLYTPQGSGTLISDIIKHNDNPGSGSEQGSGQGLDSAPGSNNSYGYMNPMQSGNDRRIVDPRTGYPYPRYPLTSGDSNPYDRNDYNYKRGHGDKKGYLDYSKSRQIRSTDDNISHDRNDDNVSEYSNMRELANDVNNSLEALEQIENDTRYKKRKNKNTNKNKETKSDTEDEDNQNLPNDESKITLETIETENDYLKLFVEFILLLTLYVIMSQPFVVSFASNYIVQLNPNEEGTISMMGIIIYGLIMTLMFFVIRKIMFSRM
jgi:hypothetical protein